MVLSAATIEKIGAIFHMKKVHRINGKRYTKEDRGKVKYISINQGRIPGRSTGRPDQCTGAKAAYERIKAASQGAQAEGQEIQTRLQKWQIMYLPQVQQV